MKLVLALLPLAHAATVQVAYGFSQVQACPGDTVVVTWSGYHNIQETATADCASADVGADIFGYQSSGYTHTFSADALVASPGTTRYFKCDLHCSATNARFEVSCPVASPSPSPPSQSPSPPPQSPSPSPPPQSPSPSPPSQSPSPPPQSPSPQSPSPSPPSPLADIICIEDTHAVVTRSGERVALRDVTTGMILRTDKGTTTVREVVSQSSADAPWVVPAGVCGATASTVVSPAHALRCDGKWTTAPSVGAREATGRLVHYVNLRTDDYCKDRLLLDTGLVVETWDGRQRDEWRPHSYADGVRINCSSP